MKKLTYLYLLLALITFLFGCHNSEKKIVLRLNHQFPATAAGSKLDAWFADEINKRTQGAVEIKIYWSNALGEAKENLTLLRNGALDMAAMSAAYFPAELPFFAAPNSLPMALNTIKQSSSLMQELVEKVPAYQEEAARHNLRPLFFHLLNPYVLFSKTPINTLADLKGKKIRTWGEDLPKLFQAAGAISANVFLPEIYENLQRNLLDAVPFALDLALTYKIYEVAAFVNETVIWEGPAWGIWINEKKWQSLSPMQQKIFQEVSAEARQKDLAMTAQAALDARKALEKAGVKFNIFSEKELAEWKKQAPNFFQSWLDKMKTLGQEEGAKATVDIWKKILSEN